MEKVHNMRTTATHQGQNIQEEANNSSGSRQLQPSSKNIQQTNMLSYDPQLQGYFIWHCHLSHDPLAATSLDHRCTLVQVTYNTFKSSATSYKNIPKQSSEKLSTSWTAKPWQLWKLLHTSSNESTCVQLHVSDIKLLTNENSWHQIQNSEMNITWTDITRHKESKTIATVKNLQNQCTASAR